MSHVPTELKYSPSHEWVKTEDNQIVIVGITEHAQELLGDLVYVELPEVGATVTKGQEIAVVESVKAASDVYSPLNGEVIEVNNALSGAPEQVNQSPYSDGWLFKLKVTDMNELNQLLDANAYTKAIEAEGH